jgi:hypothetical protein
MARISNTAVYTNLTDPVAEDYLILTDADDNLLTKTCTLSSIQTLFGIDTLVSKVSINAANLFLLATTAQILIAAPGTGKAIDIISITTYLDAGNAAYNFGNNLEVKLGSIVYGTLSSSSANFATDLVSKIETGSTTKVIDQNTAVTLTTATNPTAGTGIMYFDIYYRVLSVGTTF